MKLYFAANDIKEEKKVPVFLTVIGAKIFTLVRDLLSPKDPATCTYADIVKALTSHYKPKVIVIYERFKFYSRSQKQGESIADYIAAIKSLAHTCQFGTQLNDMLRDKFVMGLLHSSTQRQLLTECDLTFNHAVDIATAREAAIRDVQAMGLSSPPTTTTSNDNVSSDVNRMHSDKNGARSKFKPKSLQSSNTQPKSACSGCGQRHWKRDCPFKDSECFSCKKKGHIKKMCFKTKKENSSIHRATQHQEPPTDVCYDYVFSVADRKVPPISVNILLNGTRVQMEFDTGAARSVITNTTYLRLWPVSSERPQLMRSLVNLHVYGGSPLKIMGEIVVEAQLFGKSKSVSVTIIVIDSCGPCLLGRDLISKLNLHDCKLSAIHKVTTTSALTTRFPELFSPGLGCLKDTSFNIEVDPSIPPKFCRARTVPYSLREKVDKELDRLMEENIITPITHSPWAAAIVPVLKPDGSVRICGDYKLTVNKAARLDTYPIPKLQDLFSGLAGGVVFSKLDMSQAYAQLCLDEVSKKYTVINTHRGLFRYNRLCFGVSAAPGIFQRAMEGLLRTMPGVFCYLDDVLISAKSAEEHETRLGSVLTTLQQAGLKLRPEKCTIGVASVSYLGYRIDRHGLHPTKQKVQAILDAPEPRNQTQLRAYLGLLNFYRRFLPSASSLLEPLNKLLRQKEPWCWGREQNRVFRESKQVLLRSEALVHFDPTKQIVVVADSSAYGIGAVLCHVIDGVERPVCFASRSLNSAERNYSQLEKEALALVYALRQFHFYVWGQTGLTLVTDHKPLLGLFSPNKIIPPMASGRVQRWSLLLQAYNFRLVHRSGALLGTADALSRLPLPSTTESSPVPSDWSMLSWVDPGVIF